MPSLPFLGSCEVCDKPLRNYRGLAGHLRHNTDAAHRELKQRWAVWKSEYRATLRCRKCGGLFKITNKTESDKKRCDRCEALRGSMSKRAYEALSFEMPTDPRRFMASHAGKAQWDGLEVRSVTWVPEDALYQAVVADQEAEVRVTVTLRQLGITFNVYRDICEHRWGSEYERRVQDRRSRVGSKNLAIAHRRYAALTPEEKASLLKQRFGGTCALERSFSEELHEAGYRDLEMNTWQSLPIGGRRVPREADIKVAVGDGRKIVVLCDGEAFHGPKVIHGVPADRIAQDRETALAFFELGYSVLRYSETELHNGTALAHFHEVMSRLVLTQKIYRNWCPAEELVR